MMFGQNDIFSLPTLAGVDWTKPGSAGTDAFAAPQQTAPSQSFVWGGNGTRLTPDQIEQREKQVAAERAGGIDYSPVASWTQGLARVADAWLAKRDQGQIDAASQANASDNAKVIAALSSPDPATQAGAVAAALSGSDPVAQKYALQVDERLHPKPPNNDTVQDYNFRAQTLGKSAADEWLKRGGDPFVTATLPGERFYAGPQSGFAAALGGGQAPVAPVGKLTPIQGDGAGNGAGNFR